MRMGWVKSRNLDFKIDGGALFKQRELVCAYRASPVVIGVNGGCLNSININQCLHALNV